MKNILLGTSALVLGIIIAMVVYFFANPPGKKPPKYSKPVTVTERTLREIISEDTITTVNTVSEVTTTVIPNPHKSRDRTKKK